VGAYVDAQDRSGQTVEAEARGWAAGESVLLWRVLCQPAGLEEVFDSLGDSGARQ